MALELQRVVSVHALTAGRFSLPERFFVAPLADQDSRKTVPSLAFLIQHYSDPSPELPGGRLTRIIFDLGIRRDTSLYSPRIREHLKTRQPMDTSPCITESLKVGGLSPDDVDYVILSHVHWDHVGMPSDFSHSKFVIGSGSLGVLDGSWKVNNGSHSHFEAGLLPREGTIELTSPHVPLTPPLSDDGENSPLAETNDSCGIGGLNFRIWRPAFLFPSTLDIFGDSSLFIVDAPGHLPGHINLLCRVSIDPIRYVLLAADSCHDRRLLTGEKSFAEWHDPGMPGTTRCIHADKESANATLKRIRQAEQGVCSDLGHVEVVFAHDPVWELNALQAGRFFPGRL